MNASTTYFNNTKNDFSNIKLRCLTKLLCYIKKIKKFPSAKLMFYSSWRVTRWNISDYYSETEIVSHFRVPSAEAPEQEALFSIVYI